MMDVYGISGSFIIFCFWEHLKMARQSDLSSSLPPSNKGMEQRLGNDCTQQEVDSFLFTEPSKCGTTMRGTFVMVFFILGLFGQMKEKPEALARNLQKPDMEARSK